MGRPDIDSLKDKILSGDRRSLARGITLIESDRDDHQERALTLVEALLPYTGHAMRLGISGTPGAGKSTFIEAFGAHVIADGQKIAVLAIDPSSRRSGGSILGDKTRMQRLSTVEDAFIRPSPAGGTLGGIARKSREAAILCEAAGFDVIVLETVGVGQSEIDVADMVDCFVLLLAPGAGDELQGIKRGIVETADLILVNKADGDLLPAANLVRTDYQAALHLLRPATTAWTPEVLTCSALEGRGIDRVWQSILRHHQALKEAGELERKREQQLRSWFWSEIRACLINALDQDETSAALMKDLEQKIASGRLLPPKAARSLIERFRR
ncbi:MAG: methylmalonyl Co-A mutase-associated GTPase MeaB [Geminicoccaceae bacterium]